MMDREENIQRFEDLMGQVRRDGIDDLMAYIREKTDFYTAPASTRYHLSCEGGLLQHSLNVYDCLMSKRESKLWGRILEQYPDETLIIVSLLHDLCKVNFYSKGFRNQKTYDPDKVAVAETWKIKEDQLGQYIWESVPTYIIGDSMPLGHGEKSVMLINCFMKLSAPELFAIRWHMGFSEEKSQYGSIGDSMERYPLVLALYEADLEASKILEDTMGNREEWVEDMGDI